MKVICPGSYSVQSVGLEKGKSTIQRDQYNSRQHTKSGKMGYCFWGRQFQRSFNGGWWQKSRNSWFQKKRTFQEKSHPWSQLAAPFLLGRTKKMSCCRGERPYSMLPVDKSCFPYTLPPSLWVQLFLCCYLLFLSSCSISLVTPSPHWGLCVLSGPGHSFPSLPSFLPTILW